MLILHLCYKIILMCYVYGDKFKFSLAQTTTQNLNRGNVEFNREN